MFIFISSLFFPNEVWQNLLTVIDVLCQEKGVFEDSFSKKYDLKFNSKSLKKQSFRVLVHNSFKGFFKDLDQGILKTIYRRHNNRSRF